MYVYWRSYSTTRSSLTRTRSVVEPEPGVEEPKPGVQSYQNQGVKEPGPELKNQNQE